MSEKEKAPTSAATLEEAQIESQAGQLAFSYCMVPQPLSSCQAIASLLNRGRENRINTRALLKLSGCKTTRQLQRRIEQERLAGAMILSASDGGYYLPDAGIKGDLEIESFVRTVTARARNTFRIARAVKRG